MTDTLTIAVSAARVTIDLSRDVAWLLLGLAAFGGAHMVLTLRDWLVDGLAWLRRYLR